MVRECKLGEGQPHNPLHFSEKRLPYLEGSYCRVCDVWVRIPTHIPIDFRIAATNEGNNERYYDITGKQVDVRILLPVKQMAWNTRDEKGEFIKMITELVNKVICPCCHSVCRGGKHYKTDANKTKPKTLLTIDKVDNEVKPVHKQLKWVKPSLPERQQLAKKYPEKRGRPPKGSKTKILNETKNNNVT